MPVPDYQTLMLPVLRTVADGQDHHLHNIVETLAAEYRLTDEERNTFVPSGTAPLFKDRVNWARLYLKQAGLAEYRKRGYLSITERGRTLLTQGPARIDVSTLNQYPEFVASHKHISGCEPISKPTCWTRSNLRRLAFLKDW